MLLMATAITSLVTALASPAPTEKPFIRHEDIVYGRAYGTALTLDEFVPREKWNGAAVIWVVSGGWFSQHASISPDNPISPIKPLTERGYRVYAVVHRSNPYFTIEDAVADVERSVRFVRHRLAGEGHTSVPLGILGASAGGHLSLMAGTCGDNGLKKSADPVERTSNRVQAVACYFPPTDFLNYGAKGINGLETLTGKSFQAPFEFKRLNPQTKTIERVTSAAQVLTILRDVSPINHVTKDDAPTLIIHGDADMLVPLQQSQIFTEKLSETGVENRLEVRHGKGHGWAGIGKDNELLYEWFDAHLLNGNVAGRGKASATGG